MLVDARVNIDLLLKMANLCTR